MRPLPLIRSRAVTGMLALCLAIPAAADASKGGSSSSTAPSPQGCTSIQKSVTPFVPWGDLASYGLLPGGSFESTAGWTLVSAAPIAGNEPWNANSRTDATSLSVLPGGSATSSLFCATVTMPTVRFFARTSDTGASMRVDVIYTNLGGSISSLQIGTVPGTASWSPTPAMLLIANLLGFASDNGTAPLALRLTATKGSWQIDDIYIDPFRKG